MGNGESRDVSGYADGQRLTIPFKHMKVKCPIVSVRKLVRDGNEVHFEKVGGWIRNMKSGQKIRFFAFQGVYVLKVTIDNPKPLFARQGA